MHKECPWIYVLLAGVLLAGRAGTAEVISLAPSKDTTLFDYADENPEEELGNGSGKHLFVGLTDREKLRRGLIAFDVAGHVPAGSTITSVSLVLHLSRTVSGAHPMELHRMLVDWGEGPANATGFEGQGITAEPGDASWAYAFFDTVLWDAPGGDFSAVISSTTPIAREGFYTVESTPGLVADVQAWLDEPATNFGWIMLGNEAAVAKNAKRFDSREHEEDSQRPVLRIEFDRPDVETGVGARSWGQVKQQTE